MSARRPAAKPRPNSAIYVGPAPSSSFTSTSSLATITSPTSYASSSSPTKQSSPRPGLSPRSSLHSGSPSSRPTSLTLSPKASSSTITTGGTRLRPNHRHSSSFASSASSSYYNVPDLPEPPSPVSSGLPSPPATASSASGSGRGMLTEENLSRLEEPSRSARTFSPKLPEEEEWGDGDGEGEGDEGDDTLRRGLRSGDGELLKRAKSLAERNRMALDKLSSYSRLSPKPPSLHTKSSSSASSSSRPPRRVPPESGSETERESINLSVRGSEGGRPATSRGSDGRPGTSRGSDGRPVTPVGTRKRLISAPASPGKLRTMGRSPMSSPRKRASLAFADEVGIGARGGRDSVNAALAAVANSRTAGKGRAALPREWSSQGGRSGRSSVLDDNDDDDQPPRSAATTSGGFAYGTMRRHQTRWASEDLDRDLDPPSLGREQARRGGSAESALTATATGGRSVVGQGLKAAGLELRTRAGTVVGPRAASSLDHREEEAAGRGLRNARSAYPLVGGERDGAQSSMSRHSPGDGLMRESLATFQRQVGGGELWKSAREVVSAAERVQAAIRAGNSRALEEQINAEVEGSAGMNVLDIWRRVGGDYREGVRASDELVRAVTGFLLGVGKAVKDNAGDSWHGRSVSLDESGRLSRASSRSRDTPSRLSRDTPSRLDRYGERYESPAPSRFETPSRDPPRYDSQRYETPARRDALSSRDVPARYDSPARFDTLSRRDTERFETPDRDRLPQRSQTSMGSVRRVPADDFVSPSPAARPRMSLDAPRDEPEPRERERHQTLPPLSVSKATLPKPLPTLPSEGGTVGRRRRTLTSIFNPTGGGPTTALSVTTDALTRTPSSSSKGEEDKEKSTDRKRGEKDKVTFSKPEEGRAVSDLKRARTSPTVSKAMLPPVSTTRPAAPGTISRQSSTMLSPGTGSETERPRPRSGSVRVLDGGHAADRAASIRADVGRSGGERERERENTRTVGKGRERRGTIVDLWPPKGK